MTYTEFVENIRWPALLPEPIENESHRVRELCTPQELYMHGKKMGNCVPTCVEWCIKPKNSLHILQFEELETESVVAVGNFTETSNISRNTVKVGLLLDKYNMETSNSSRIQLFETAHKKMTEYGTRDRRSENLAIRTEIWEGYKKALKRFTMDDYETHCKYRPSSIQQIYQKSLREVLPMSGNPPRSEWPLEEVKRMYPYKRIILV